MSDKPSTLRSTSASSVVCFIIGVVIFVVALAFALYAAIHAPYGFALSFEEWKLIGIGSLVALPWLIFAALIEHVYQSRILLSEIRDELANKKG